jgi:hypothetical protein
VGNGDRSVRLYLRPERDIRNSTLPTDSGGNAMTESIDVPAISIAEVLDQPVDLLKVDCEGGEFAIFANAGDRLRNVSRIVAEIHTNAGDPQQALDDVRRAGFDATLQGDPAGELMFLTACRREPA